MPDNPTGSGLQSAGFTAAANMSGFKPPKLDHQAFAANPSVGLRSGTALRRMIPTAFSQGIASPITKQLSSITTSFSGVPNKPLATMRPLPSAPLPAPKFGLSAASSPFNAMQDMQSPMKQMDWAETGLGDKPIGAGGGDQAFGSAFQDLMAPSGLSHNAGQSVGVGDFRGTPMANTMPQFGGQVGDPMGGMGPMGGMSSNFGMGSMGGMPPMGFSYRPGPTRFLSIPAINAGPSPADLISPTQAPESQPNMHTMKSQGEKLTPVSPPPQSALAQSTRHPLADMKSQQDEMPAGGMPQPAPTKDPAKELVESAKGLSREPGSAMPGRSKSIYNMHSAHGQKGYERMLGSMTQGTPKPSSGKSAFGFLRKGQSMQYGPQGSKLVQAGDALFTKKAGPGQQWDFMKRQMMPKQMPQQRPAMAMPGQGGGMPQGASQQLGQPMPFSGPQSLKPLNDGLVGDPKTNTERKLQIGLAGSQSQGATQFPPPAYGPSTGPSQPQLQRSNGYESYMPFVRDMERDSGQPLSREGLEPEMMPQPAYAQQRRAMPRQTEGPSYTGEAQPPGNQMPPGAPAFMPAGDGSGAGQGLGNTGSQAPPAPALQGAPPAPAGNPMDALMEGARGLFNTGADPLGPGSYPQPPGGPPAPQAQPPQAAPPSSGGMPPVAQRQYQPPNTDPQFPEHLAPGEQPPQPQQPQSASSGVPEPSAEPDGMNAMERQLAGVTTGEAEPHRFSKQIARARAAGNDKEVKRLQRMGGEGDRELAKLKALQEAGKPLQSHETDYLARRDLYDSGADPNAFNEDRDVGQMIAAGLPLYDRGEGQPERQQQQPPTNLPTRPQQQYSGRNMIDPESRAIANAGSTAELNQIADDQGARRVGNTNRERFGMPDDARYGRRGPSAAQQAR